MSLTRVDYYNYLFRVYFLKRGTITKSWRHPSVLSSDDINQEPVQWAYPIDFSQDIVPKLLTDSGSIPMIDYTNLGRHYNPWFVGHIALGYHSKWRKTTNEVDLVSFKQLADWFVDTAVDTKNGKAWFYHFDWFGGHEKPWRSGLSQAHAISTLLRAATIFKEHKYERVAKAATMEMTASFEKDGAAFFWDDGSVSFEESILTPPSTVLNGHLFSVFACWEAALYFNDSDLNTLYKKGFQFALNRLPDYDLGFWSKYSLLKKKAISDIASVHYHDVHIAQLKAAHQITNEPTFMEYAQKFDNYQNKSVNRNKAIWYKRIAKLI
ncbi:MAG: D-glucuronyl C5-epimerase family protein [Bacteroidales bacterium]|jgi:hypothetical protein|nr:D-glucuronyl C5-epimerase family protein [Bacteroidales bacterium]MDX9795633.1 D-glucuronyl C5-epimerase family protein [Arcobacteraceae bacterium]